MGSYTIWDSINNGVNPAGAVVFSNAQGTPVIDFNNFYYNAALFQLYIGNAGDISGTDTLNLYRQGDSYVPVAQQVLANNIIGGWTVSTSRGSGPSALPNLTGDMAGEYSGFGYIGDPTNVTPNLGAYVRLAGMNIYVLGATAANPGGEGRLHAKRDNSALDVEVLAWNVDTLGIQAIYPPVDGATQFGKPGKGIGKICLQSTGAVAPIAGAQAINKASGKFQIALGQQSVVISNTLLGPNDVVILQLLTVDANAKSAVSVNAGAALGANSFTATLNAACAAAVNLHFEIRQYS